MALQDALKLIHLLRKDDAGKIKDLSFLLELVALAENYNLTCTVEDLKLAFYTDWTMRWAKFQSSI